MPRLLDRQARGPFSPREVAELDEQIPYPIDALTVDGCDATAAHRARSRAMNAARQAAEASAPNRKTEATTRAWAALPAADRAAHRHGPSVPAREVPPAPRRPTDYQKHPPEGR